MSQPRRRVSPHFRIDAPRAVWVAILTAWGELRDATGKPPPFTREMACMSLRLDVDAGTIKSIREYASIWSWPKWKVEEDLPAIRGEVCGWGVEVPEPVKRGGRTTAGQPPDKKPPDSAENEESSDKSRTNPGRENPGQNTGQIPDSLPDKKPPDSAENEESSDSLPDKSRTPDQTLTTHPPPTEEGELECVGSARDPERLKFNPAYAWPTEEDVLEFTRSASVDDETARELFRYCTGLGWKTAQGAPVGHWGQYILSLVDSRRYRLKQQQQRGRNGRSGISGSADGIDYSKPFSA